MATRVYTEQDRSVALSYLTATGNDFRAAARKAKVSEQVLRFWAQGGTVEASTGLEIASNTRPLPPSELMDSLRYPEQFLPAPELDAWARSVFLDESGPLFNPDHLHLIDARIGWLWTNAPCAKNGMTVAGQCEKPFPRGDQWAKARYFAQVNAWFGGEPDFIITLDAPLSGLRDDASFCALVEHEMYHAGQAKDEYGCPRYRKDGTPVFTIRGHDVEEFVGVVARYGADSAAGATSILVEAANRGPKIALASVAAACGTCLGV